MTPFENKLEYVNNIKSLGPVKDTKKYWGNIPVRVELLLPLLKIFEEGFRLVDLGSGVGHVLRFAENLGYDVTGVELDETLVKQCVKHKCHHGNIEDLENSFFKEFDVVYSYLPLKDNVQVFIDKVVESMKPGAYLVLPEIRPKNKNLVHVDGCYYRKRNIENLT